MAIFRARPAKSLHCSIIQRAHQAHWSALEHVCVCHGSAQVAVTEQRAASGSSERRSPARGGAAAHRFAEAGLKHRGAHRPLQHRLVRVVAAPLSRLAINVGSGSRKHPLPGPIARCAGVLQPQPAGQSHAASAILQIGVVLKPHPFQMTVERL